MTDDIFPDETRLTSSLHSPKSYYRNLTWGGRVSEIHIEVDLMKAATKLERQGRYVNFASLVRKYLGASSALTDLEYAMRKLQIMTKLSTAQLSGPPSQDQEQDEENALINASLFAHAVILYARAIAASPNGGRKDPPITANFTHEQRASSENILDLRNKGIAHFDKTNKLIDGSYSLETALYRRTLDVLTGEKRIFFDHIYTRYNYKQNLVQDLANCVIPAAAACTQMKDTLYNELGDEIARLTANYPDFEKALEKYLFVPEDYGLTGPVGYRHIIGPSTPREIAKDSAAANTANR